MPVDENRDASDRERESDGVPGDERSPSRDASDGANRPSTRAGTPEPRLASRVLVTWIELTIVGITGGLLGDAVGGPPGFVVYLATTLVTVGIIFYNVNELVKAWLRRRDRTADAVNS